MLPNSGGMVPIMPLFSNLICKISNTNARLRHIRISMQGIPVLGYTNPMLLLHMCEHMDTKGLCWCPCHCVALQLDSIAPLERQLERSMLCTPPCTAGWQLAAIGLGQ
jgi:hypothetical protein